MMSTPIQFGIIVDVNARVAAVSPPPSWVQEERPRNGSSPRDGQQRRRRRRMYQPFLHGVPTTLIPRLHGAATTLETTLRTCWCPGLRFPAAAAGTTASATGDGGGCATPSSLIGAALHGDAADVASTVRMRASSRVAAELWRMETSPGPWDGAGMENAMVPDLPCVYLYVPDGYVRLWPARGSCWAPAASDHRCRCSSFGWFVRHGWCSCADHGSRMGEAILIQIFSYIYKCIYMSIR